jgi:TPP-dependent indolepyruvate ferredoxin oxidoreductase alpha subunit
MKCKECVRYSNCIILVYEPLLKEKFSPNCPCLKCFLMITCSSKCMSFKRYSIKPYKEYIDRVTVNCKDKDKNSIYINNRRRAFLNVFND